MKEKQNKKGKRSFPIKKEVSKTYLFLRLTRLVFQRDHGIFIAAITTGNKRLINSAFMIHIYNLINQPRRDFLFLFVHEVVAYCLNGN